MNDSTMDDGQQAVGVTMHPACLPIDALLEQCEIRRTRASGPGGQHRNKVETAIEIIHKPSGLHAMATERRSQDQNRQVAIDRLRIHLAVYLRTVSSDFVEPSPLWVSRCRNNRISCSDQHDDFPSMISEALNAVDAKSWDVKRAAAALGCSTSQLVRFIAKAPDALNHMNSQREANGLKRLKP